MNREAYLVFRGTLFIVHGSLVNLVNMDNLVKWLSYNLDPRLRHSGTSLTGLFGVYLLIRDPRLRHSRTSFAVLRYIYRLLAVYVSLLANICVL